MQIAVKIGAGGVLTIILTLAKLVGLFPFSWWFVALPLIVAYAITFLLITYAALTIGSDDE